MAITDRAEINKLVEIFESRGAKLYHACQLQDFRSYVSLGGVPSRKCLTDNKLDFTAFDTDKRDMVKNVWDKVFGNFSDFGREFARQNTRSYPNPYGPIQLVFNPRVLLQVSDIAITVRSAGAWDFDREGESLTEANQVNNIFTYPDISNVGYYQRSYIAYDRELNERFDRSDCKSPEFNCAIDGGLMRFEYCTEIIVDGCVYKNGMLFDEVNKIAPCPVSSRRYECSDKERIINELSMLSAQYDCTQEFIASSGVASELLKVWVAQCNGFFYDRYIRYLTFGTSRI